MDVFSLVIFSQVDLCKYNLKAEMNNLLRLFPPLKSGRTLVPVFRRSSSYKTEDIVTHTGQKWDCNDYRMVRFMNSDKVTNPNWAVNLVAEVPVIQMYQRVVWCDGGSGPEGHPKVFINLDKPGEHACGYCGLRFEKIHEDHWWSVIKYFHVIVTTHWIQLSNTSWM